MIASAKDAMFAEKPQLRLLSSSLHLTASIG